MASHLAHEHAKNGKGISEYLRQQPVKTFLISRNPSLDSLPPDSFILSHPPRLCGIGGGGLLSDGKALVGGSVSFAAGLGRGVVGLGLHEGVAVVSLVEAHNDETNHDGDPVEVVREDRAVGGGVGPAEDGVEDTPTAVVSTLRSAALETS